MYGIEYQTIASLIRDDDVDDDFTQIKTANSINLTNESSALTNNKFSYLSQNLLSKLQNLKKCPDYLLPKTKLINKTSSVTSPTTNVVSSSKNNKNYYTDDFILLSEFSEIEGPKPLLTIPTDGGTGFNKNEYSLHLMCVDFHSHINQTVQSSHNDETAKRINKFNLTKDTSIINYWDVANSVAACVHHFNLYDLEARGFVRPFCLAYISYDRIKPVVYFEQIRERFTEITDLLKKSNYNLFKLDLEQRCLDLKLTRDLFLKWSQNDSDDLKTIRSNLAKQHKLDARTCARLTASSTNEKTKQLQLNAIDTLAKELENVIDVIKTELKKKNWLKLHKLTSNKIKINNSSDCVSSNNDSSIENTVINRTNRSLTYPLDKNNTNKTICPNRKFKFTLRTPKIFTNILIGNLNILQPGDTEGFCSGIDFQQLNQSAKLQYNKSMKRLQQLSCHTARQAINEMRLMQLYFSTPLYLFKFRELTQPLTSQNRANFWSIMCGDISLVNFGIHIDIFNLTKHNMTKMSHLNKLKSPNESIINSNKLKENEIENETLIYSADRHDSVRTQFYSPVNNERTSNWIINQSNDTNDSSDIEVLSKITSNDTKSDDYFTTARETAWETAIEQFLDLEQDNDKKEPIVKDDEDKDDDDEEFHDNYDEDTLSNEYLDENNKEESEYDFVNSLLTADYKPYNQYSTNYNDIGSSSLSLSSSFTSPAIIYSAFNRCKYQANLTDKLIQIIEFNFEETLKKLLSNYYTLLPPLFYSLLKGRPVICVSRYCDDQAYLTAIVDCLSNFILNSFDSLNDLLSPNSRPKFTSSPCNNGYDLTHLNLNSHDKPKQPQLRTIYERKPIKLNDLKYCKLFGLSLMISKDDTCCSHDCNSNLVRQEDHADTLSLNSSTTSSKKRSKSFYKHRHKHYHLNKSTSDDESLLLKYIPITVRNYVSIFDLDKGTFTGPKYAGSHIKNCLHKAKQMQQDSIIYLYLLTHLVKHYVKIAFIYNYSILFDHDINQQQQQQHQQITIKKTNQTSRKNSLQPRSSIDLGNSDRELFNSKRERLKRYFALYNTNLTISNDLANLDSKSTKSYYSSLSSIASSLLGYDSNIRNQNKKTSIKSYSDDDLEVLKVILSLVDLSSNKTVNSTNSSSPVTNVSQTNSSFDQHDFYIVNHLLNSLQIKQLYLYDLAIRRKHIKEISHHQFQMKQNDSVISKSSDSTTSNLIENEIQFPLIVDYEELTVFNIKNFNINK